METRTLQKGALEAGQVQEKSAALPVEAPTSQPGEDTPQAVDTACVGGAMGLASASEPVYPIAPDPAEERRYGYRQDSPPEVITLLHQAQAGDKEAFAELYRLHVDRITRYVSARMRDEDRSAIPDVVQDTFCEALAELPSAHHDVTGWLLAHAAKAYIRFARSDRKQERAVKGAKEVVRREYAHGYARHHPGNITTIGHIMLVHALSRLASSQREVVQHRYLEGQTQKATAMLLGKTLSAVRSAEHRALVKLRDELSGRQISDTSPPPLVPAAAQPAPSVSYLPRLQLTGA